ncbi:winged helix DNA-binding protein [Martelella alba]|uniref:Winged helix DNA-binding protein n=1 Tax=Martelella alba TaxID=2590451 RepID=A0A506U315_9HYPH|nr:MarR family transcriptional regulator [Martelella alba]TPW26979.1 winged helix DNA-binding protein [Martelella alba]
MKDEDLHRLLGQLRALQRRQRRERPPVEGLSQSAVRVLGVVARSESAIQPTKIGRELIMTSSNVASALSALTKRGLVERIADKVDTRRVNITLTPAGKRLVAEDRASRDDWLTHAIHDLLTQEEESVLIAGGFILERLADYHPEPPHTRAMGYK